MEKSYGEKLLDYSKNREFGVFDFFDSDELKAIEEEKLFQEPKKVVTKQKKRKSAKKVLCDLVRVLIVIGLIGVIGYTLIAGTKMDMHEDGFNIRIGNYGKNPTWMQYGSSTEVNTIYSQLSQKGELQTAYDIYELACKRLNLSKEYSVRASGNLDLAAGDTVASVISNREEHYYVVAEPTLNANQLTEYSNYDITYFTDFEGVDTIASILQAAIVFGVRSYCDGNTVYEQRSKALEKNEDDVYIAVWQNKYIELEKDFERSYEDGELREKTNFVINTSTILADTVEIEKQTVGGVNLYNVKFKLDCSTTDLGSATYYEAEAIKRKMGNTENFVYDYMDVEFSVYENGYFSYWASQQKYSLKYVLTKAIKFNISATMNKQEYISYDTDECNVVNFLED